MILMPEHMIANGEVWDAFKEIQAKLAQQESLIEEKFLEQQNAIQTAHTQMMQGLELQNQQMENQHLFNKVSAGLFCAVLLVAIIQMIITIVQNNKIRKMQKKIDQMEEENSQYASCQKEQEKNWKEYGTQSTLLANKLERYREECHGNRWRLAYQQRFPSP